VAGAQTDAVAYVLDGGTHNENYIHSTRGCNTPPSLSAVSETLRRPDAAGVKGSASPECF